MSISNLISPFPKDWSKINAQAINTKKLDLNSGEITNVSRINGYPIPSTGIELNPVNIIYRPGGLEPELSNIVNTWQKVVNKINSTNVNQTLNVYIDSSLSPYPYAPIDVSINCQTRVKFLPMIENAGNPSRCRIMDGIRLLNPGEFTGTLVVECESISSVSIQLDNNGILVCRDGAQLINTTTSLVPSIQIDSNNFNVISSGYGGLISSSNLISLINVNNNSQLVFAMFINTTGQPYQNGLISSSDNTGQLTLILDSSSYSNNINNPGFLGSVNKFSIDNSVGINYDDLLQPQFGASNLQDVLDNIKNNGLSTNGQLRTGDSVFCGNKICSTIGLNGQILMQLYPDSDGQIYLANGPTGTNLAALISATKYRMYTDLQMEPSKTITCNDLNAGTNTVTCGSSLCSSLTINSGTEIAKLEQGLLFVGTGNLGVNQYVLNFPSSFSNPPRLLVSVLNGSDDDSTFCVSIRTVSTTQAKVNIYRIDVPGGNWTQDIYLNWLAYE